MVNNLQLELMTTLSDKEKNLHAQAVLFAVYKTVAINSGITEVKLKWILDRSFRIPSTSIDAALALLLNKDYANGLTRWETKYASHMNVVKEYEVHINEMLESYPELAEFKAPSLHRKNTERKT